MKIIKRGSNYRVQMQENGVRYSLTFPHKPTHKEIFEKLAIAMPVVEKGSSLMFANKYIDMKSIYIHTFEEERKYITQNINDKIVENIL